jgi:hypothetical protein
MQGSGSAVSRSHLSRAARKRLVAVVGEDVLDADLSPDRREDVQRLLVDAFLDDRITVADYRVGIDAFTE